VIAIAILDWGTLHLELDAIPVWLHIRRMKEKLIAFNR
jgi:hypothetical protein